MLSQHLANLSGGLAHEMHSLTHAFSLSFSGVFSNVKYIVPRYLQPQGNQSSNEFANNSKPE